jgi:hypothetical protein
MMRIGCSWIQRCFADELRAEQLLDYPDAYPASSFVACHKQSYARGYREGELDQSGTQGSECS